MNTNRQIIRSLALLALVTINTQFSGVLAQVTAFTYQGRLNNSGQPANGSYDFQFTLYHTNTDGDPVAGPLTNFGVTVANGQFSTTVDFGMGVFDGTSYWLDLAVCTNGEGSFTALTHRQALLPVPYALFAANAGNLAGLVIQPNLDGAPNVIGGSPANYVSPGAEGGTIGGGGSTNYDGVTAANVVAGNYGTVGGGLWNTAGNTATVSGGYHNAGGTEATVGGGAYNLAGGSAATIGGGDQNNASGSGATVAGGHFNSASASAATVGGGYGNIASGSSATIGGGYSNQATTNYAVVPGGYLNLAGGAYSFAAGYKAQATNDGAFVWADAQGTPFTSTTSNQFNLRASGGVRLVTSGAGLSVDGAPALTTGSGSLGLTIQQNTNGAPNIIAGSPVNFVSSGVVGATIGGGGATNWGGVAYSNTVTGVFGTVAGGRQNSANGGFATVSGGYGNSAKSDYDAVGGGFGNTARLVGATVSGGYQNTADGYAATVGGGEGNQAIFPDATVPGGAYNVASGQFSFAAGRFAGATNHGAFVWSDGTGTATFSSADEQFVARASGGFVFYTSTGNTGVSLAPGSGSWSSLSDRDAKNNFAAVDSRTVLAQVAALPLTTWSYRTQPGVRHLGPMAQDFYGAFGVGEDEKHIAEVDEGGVALAAIQGLNQKVDAETASLREELKRRDTENADLKREVSELKRMLTLLSQKLDAGAK